MKRLKKRSSEEQHSGRHLRPKTETSENNRNQAVRSTDRPRYSVLRLREVENDGPYPRQGEAKVEAERRNIDPRRCSGWWTVLRDDGWWVTKEDQEISDTSDDGSEGEDHTESSSSADVPSFSITTPTPPGSCTATTKQVQVDELVDRPDDDTLSGDP
jgi:hypothetical protein